MSASQRRQRTDMLHLRLYGEELQELRDRAAELGPHVKVSEVVRAHLFNTPLHTTTPCSDKPHNCNPQHRDMVLGYRDQRYREELAYEAETNHGRGEHEHWKAMGGRMVTFSEWLRRHTR